MFNVPLQAVFLPREGAASSCNSNDGIKKGNEAITQTRAQRSEATGTMIRDKTVAGQRAHSETKPGLGI